MAASDKLVERTRQIIEHADCKWCNENPAFSYVWKREVAAGLLEKSVITSYCSFGYPYRRHARLANNIPLVLPKCPRRGLCPSMVGNLHIEHAQRRRDGHRAKSHTTDQLHRIPERLVQEIFKQPNVRSNTSKD